MDKKRMPTEFLPAERAEAQEISSAQECFSRIQGIRQGIEAMPFPVLVLNRQRQMVYHNAATEKFAESHGGDRGFVIYDEHRPFTL